MISSLMCLKGTNEGPVSVGYTATYTPYSHNPVVLARGYSLSLFRCGRLVGQPLAHS